MSKLFNFARVIITNGQYKGCIGRVFASSAAFAPPGPPPPPCTRVPVYHDIAYVTGDNGDANLECRDLPTLYLAAIYNDGAELIEDGIKQPSSVFLFQHAKRFREIINTAMEDCIKDESKFNLEHINALGELSDLIFHQETGYEEPFWDLYVKTFGLKMKKRPKSARKLA